MPAEGDKIPAFTAHDQDAKPRTFADLTGPKGLVLYFYPKDQTPGCTLEAQGFRDQLAAFKAAGVHVAGVSPDDVKSHCKFIDKEGLTFPLLADVEHKVLEAFGAWGEKTLYGKKSVGVIRTTVLIDAAGTIKKLWKSVKVDGHVAKVLAAAQGL